MKVDATGKWLGWGRTIQHYSIDLLITGACAAVIDPLLIGRADGFSVTLTTRQPERVRAVSIEAPDVRVRSFVKPPRENYVPAAAG
ncbi:MAG TPA: hypothetical protein VFF64_02540 [Candidatus Eremiobacteraceae bacterium]|nr:hypothetical protein [Candidatus Eremiobacteraceae bacterium]